MVSMVALDGLVTFAEAYAQVGLLRAGTPLPGASAALAVSEASWVIAFAGLTFLVLLFPDGRLLGPRWRVLVWVSAVAFAGSWVGVTLQPGTLDAPFDRVQNPVGVAWLDGAGQVAVGAFVITMFGCMLATTVAVVLRYRRSVGVERAQMRWLTYAAGLLPLALGVCIVLQAVTGEVDAVSVVFDLAIVAIPAAVGVAVLRYRLYDIDRLISRTVLYAALSLLLVAAFVLTASLVAVAAGRGSSWATAIAAAVTVAVLRPLRNRLQAPIERRFDPARFDGLATVDHFLEDLRADRTDPDAIEDVLRRAFGDPDLRVWLWLPARGDWVDVHGRTVTDTARHPAGAVTQLDHGGAPLAIIAHGPSSSVRPDILTSVLDRATLAIEIARLRAEVSATVADVEQSRTRIVEAGYEERRRLERDLHDGAQQRLVSLGLSLRRLQRSLPPQARILEPALDQAVDEIGHAITDLRRIASGIRPARSTTDSPPRSTTSPATPRSPSPSPSPPSARRRPSRPPRTTSRAKPSPTRSSTRTPPTSPSTPNDTTAPSTSCRRRRHRRRSDPPRDRPGRARRPCLRPRRHLRAEQPTRGRHADGGTPAMRVVIAEDTVLLREGLAGLMEDAGHDVVARVGDGDSLIAVVAEHEPDLAVVDVRMPPTTTTKDSSQPPPSDPATRPPQSSSSPNISRPATPSISSPPAADSATSSRTESSTSTTSSTPPTASPWRHSPRPRSRHSPAEPPPHRRRATRRPHRPRDPSPRTHGRRPHQQRDRPTTLAHREDHREPCPSHHDQTRTRCLNRRQPTRTRSRDLPRSFSPRQSVPMSSDPHHLTGNADIPDPHQSSSAPRAGYGHRAGCDVQPAAQARPPQYRTSTSECGGLAPADGHRWPEGSAGDSPAPHLPPRTPPRPPARCHRWRWPG